jgi:hypothetical protein
MKHSKELPIWLRNRSWAMFMRMSSQEREIWFNNNFEAFCKKVSTGEIYRLSLQFLKNRPRLKG